MAAGHSMKRVKNLKGTDKVRYKEVDGKLMPLELKWAYSEDDLSRSLQHYHSAGSQKIGMKFEGTKMDFAQMINHLNREGVDATYNVFLRCCFAGVQLLVVFLHDAPERMGLWNYYRISYRN